MKKYSLFAALIISFVLSEILVVNSAQAAVSKTALERRSFKRVNQHRVAEDLQKLKWNDKVTEIARTHSKNMAHGRVDFGHDGFNKRFKKIQNQIPHVMSVGENVAYTTVTPGTAKHVVDLWINSSGHRANIETSEFNVSGMGVAKKGRYYYFTQLFVYKK